MYTHCPYLLEQIWVSAHWEAAQHARYLASWWPLSTSISIPIPTRLIGGLFESYRCKRNTFPRKSGKGIEKAMFFTVVRWYTQKRTLQIIN